MSSLKTKAFDISAKNKANSLAAKFATKKDQVTGSTTPAAKDDLLARMNVDKKADIDEGAHLTMDVQPDSRPWFMAFCYYAAVWYPQLEQDGHGKLTPATLVMYFYAIFYAHFLVCDYYIRGSPSAYASHFMSDPARRSYLQDLLNLPVPDFMLKLFSITAPTSDPRRPLIDYIPSFAGHNLSHDFGRYFPLTIFARMHTIAATAKSNQEISALFETFMCTQISSGYVTRVGNYFGAAMRVGNDSTTVDNKLFQALTGLFNPAVERSITRRTFFTRIPQAVIEFAEYSNPYIFYLNATEDHISEMSTVLESISAACSQKMKFSGVLGNQYDNLAGANILIHGYSAFALPTWHFATTGKSGSGVEKTVTITERANALKWKSKHTYAKKNDLGYPKDATDVSPMLLLINKSAHDPKNEFPAADDYTLFKAPGDAYPRVRVFDPYNYDPSTFAFPILGGLVIESEELAGFAVPQPNLKTNLESENSFLLNSALPLSHVRKATDFNGTVVHTVIKVNEHDLTAQPVMASLYRVEQDWLPRFDLDVSDDPLPTSLFGFNLVDHVSSLARAFSKFGFLTRNPENKTDSVTKPNAPKHSVYLWSPYRFVSPAFKWNAAAPGSPDDYVYMVANFRTVYGTNVTLAEVKHFQESIPIN